MRRLATTAFLLTIAAPALALDAADVAAVVAEERHVQSVGWVEGADVPTLRAEVDGTALLAAWFRSRAETRLKQIQFDATGEPDQPLWNALALDPGALDAVVPYVADALATAAEANEVASIARREAARSLIEGACGSLVWNDLAEPGALAIEVADRAGLMLGDLC